MSEENSALWNALEMLVGAWAHTLADSLETDTEPDWGALSADLSAATYITGLLRERSQATPSQNEEA